MVAAAVIGSRSGKPTGGGRLLGGATRSAPRREYGRKSRNAGGSTQRRVASTSRWSFWAVIVERSSKVALTRVSKAPSASSNSSGE